MGIKNSDDYEDGNFFGNTSLDGITIYEKVTYNFTDFVREIELLYQNGKKIKFKHDDLLSLQTGITATQKYGRCYELDVFKNRNHSLTSATMYINRDLGVYIDLPFQYYTNARNRMFAKKDEYMHRKVNYEILIINHDEDCKKYSESYDGSYDQCKASFINERIQRELNCSVPFFMRPGKICAGAMAKNASEIYKHHFKAETEQCPPPCKHIISTFGAPKIKQHKKGRVRFYFSNIVKVTEDFVSYDLVRWLN